MEIKLYFFGKSKDQLGSELEYVRRLNFKVPFSVLALSASKQKDPSVAKQEEAERLLKRLAPDAILIGFDERGKVYDSIAYSKWLCNLKYLNKPLVMVIGGAAGLDQAVRDRANYLVSFGPMIWTKDLFRLMCLEQCYRAFEIESGSKFHKG